MPGTWVLDSAVCLLLLGGAPIAAAAGPAQRAARVPASGVLLRTRAELDGRGGPEEIVLYRNGTLIAGKARGRAATTGADTFWLEHQASLRVVELDRAHHMRALLVTLPIHEAEDPPNRYQLFVRRGKALRRILDLAPGVYGVIALEFPGDGSVSYIEDGWSACLRVHARTGSPPVPRRKVTFRRRGNGPLRQVGHTDTKLTQDCDQLAACPRVYVVSEGGARLAGEILRNLRGSRAYASQSLALPPGRSHLRLRIAEEKPEVTYLDQVEVDLGGTRIAPRACGRMEPPAYCRADRRPYVLRPGDVLELDFDLGSRPRAALTLHARGYYLPTPTLHLRPRINLLNAR